jgi:hypothetical protein
MGEVYVLFFCGKLRYIGKSILFIKYLLYSSLPALCKIFIIPNVCLVLETFVHTPVSVHVNVCYFCPILTKSDML